MELITILIAAVFSHNLAFTYILGMCPFISLSKSLKTAAGMGTAVTFVVALTAAINWPVYRYVLVPLKSEFLYFIVFIIVIAATVQLLEMLIERFFPVLQAHFGIFLPLITVNCIVLSVSLFMVLRNYSFFKTVFFAFGSALGWTLAIIMVSAIRQKVELVGDVPDGLKGAGITMVIAGTVALAFMGFAGIVGVQ